MLLDKASGDFSEKVLGTLTDTESDPLIVTFSGLENYMIAIYDQVSGLIKFSIIDPEKAVNGNYTLRYDV